jgi:hypothetical protein
MHPLSRRLHALLIAEIATGQELALSVNKALEIETGKR